MNSKTFLSMIAIAALYTAQACGAAINGTVWSSARGVIYPATQAQVVARNTVTGATFRTTASIKASTGSKIAENAFAFTGIPVGTYAITARFYSPVTKRWQTNEISVQSVVSRSFPTANNVIVYVK